ncbi:hypothetical protein LCGC14_1017970 [marine sediment metagenome]|uniref:Calcineurin-like phosphoesterase domain-containing protein n=1 Tax=marine sediment metagenome TaxID=412755 RepID=A0A0F9MYA9_9ZZZZ
MGAIHSKESFFDLFLSSLLYRLKNEDLPKLKALIILGDFFDLIMDSYEDLLEFGVYRSILDQFETLHQMEDFHLIFALGNHEIPLIGDYNKKFTFNKDKMIQNFNTQQKKMGLNYSFFTNNIFSQYILFQPDEDGASQPLIKLFDTEHDVLTNNSINAFNLNTETLSTDINYYLLTHGFQFDPALKTFSKFWNLGLLNPFSVLKQIGDGIWNGFLKKIYDKARALFYYTKREIKEMVKEESKTFIAGKNLQLNKTDNKQLDKDVNLKKKSDMHREAIRDNQGCIKKIVKFIPKFVNNGIPINHVIYGHTHDKLRPLARLFNRRVQPSPNQFQFEVDLQPSKFLISNTGAWQHVKKPSFIEIHSDWEVKPQTVPLKLSEVEQIIKR